MKRFIANAYLLLDLIGNGLGFAMSLLAFGGGTDLSDSQFLNFVAAVDLLLVLPAFWVLGSAANIPKRTFLPLIIPLIGAILYTPESPSFSDAALSLIYFGISIYCFVERKNLTDNLIGIIPGNYFEKESRTFKRAFAITGTALVIIVLAISFQIGKLVYEGVFKGTEGALLLKLDGLYSRSLTFEKGERKVTVLSLVHYADRGFYERMIEKIPVGNTVVLLEGILDRKELLGSFVPHTETEYGMTSQMGTFNKWIKTRYNFILSDLDIADFSANVRDHAIKSFSKESPFQGVLDSGLDKKGSDKKNEQILRERNERLMRVFDVEEPKYKDIVITWGSAHTPYIAKSLQERGYNSRFARV